MSIVTAVNAGSSTIASRTSAEATTGRVRRWRGVIVAFFTLFLGIGAGVALTYVFVLIPRARELRVNGYGSDFFNSFQPQPIIADLAAEVSSRKAKPVWNAAGVEPQTAPAGNPRKLAKYYDATIPLNPAEQLAFQTRLVTHITQSFSKLGIGLNGIDSTSAAGNVSERFRFDYNGRSSAGFVMIWCIPREQDLRLVFIMVED